MNDQKVIERQLPPEPLYQFRSTEVYREEDDPDWSELDAIYANYADAMKRRDREPLEEDRFYSHFFAGGSYEESMMYGDKSDGYLLGQELGGYLSPHTLHQVD